MEDQEPEPDQETQVKQAALRERLAVQAVIAKARPSFTLAESEAFHEGYATFSPGGLGGIGKAMGQCPHRRSGETVIDGNPMARAWIMGWRMAEFDWQDDQALLERRAVEEEGP